MLGQLVRDGGERYGKLESLAFEVRETTSVGIEEAAEEKRRFVFGVEPFFTPCGPSKVLGSDSAKLDFSVEAPTTSKNLRRVLRSLQVGVREGEQVHKVSLQALLHFFPRIALLSNTAVR